MSSGVPPLARVSICRILRGMVRPLSQWRCKRVFRSHQCLCSPPPPYPPPPDIPLFRPSGTGRLSLPRCLSSCSRQTFANSSPLQRPRPSSWGPRTGVLPFCACLRWPRGPFLSVSLQVPRGRDWAQRQLPSPNPEQTRKALVVPQTFCSKAEKSPAHAPGAHSACQPGLACGLWGGSQATRAGPGPLPLLASPGSLSLGLRQREPRVWHHFLFWTTTSHLT